MKTTLTIEFTQPENLSKEEFIEQLLDNKEKIKKDIAVGKELSKVADILTNTMKSHANFDKEMKDDPKIIEGLQMLRGANTRIVVKETMIQAIDAILVKVMEVPQDNTNEALPQTEVPATDMRS